MYNNPYQFNMYGGMNQFPSQQRSNILPQQQIIQVNGKASVDTIQLAPNSSILVMDTSAPIVWMCVSDGVGNVTSTPYDITVHQEKPPVDVSNFEQRLVSVETAISEIMGSLNNGSKSNVRNAKSKSANAEVSTD